MNRPPTSPRTQPLTAEERVLADRLARIGPHDGPSPALDARILAAAQAAVDKDVDVRAGRPANPRRRRWLGLTGMPAALITGAGMAASLALAIGVVWQLRPTPMLLPAPRETLADNGFVEVRAAKSTKSAINAPAPPPDDLAGAPPGSAPSTAVSSTDRAAALPAAASDSALVTRKSAAASPTAASPPAASPVAAMEAGASVDASPDCESAARQQAQLRQPSARTAPPSVPAAPAPAAAAPRRPSYTNSARAASGVPVQESATRNSAARQAATAESDNATLDRIEVTGTRIGRTHIPVEEDAQLEPVAWLQRIRERRDEGDFDRARASLALFRRDHPRLILPDDLRALASDTPE